jgi:hypothetical protein
MSDTNSTDGGMWRCSHCGARKQNMTAMWICYDCHCKIDMLQQKLDELQKENDELRKRQIPYGWICHP